MIQTNFIKQKVISYQLGLTSSQEEDLISNLSKSYQNRCVTEVDLALDTILTGIKVRNIYYDSWVRHLDVMN